ncbi:MAG: hypothetical protein JJU13_13705 [Balneolaceae bacterium]|nr:hypothetical protein [Balneolaceae bacterium]
MKIIHYLNIFCFLFITACATSSSYSSLEDQPHDEESPRELMIPAGVDSVIAAEARELADSSFVTYQREQEAEELKRRANAYRAESDTLWHYLSLEATDEPDNMQDDPDFVDSFNEGAQYFGEATTIAESNEISEADLEQYSLLLANAINSFEEALQLNPFDSQTRLVLAQLYGAKANRLNQTENYERAIDILEKLVRLEQGQFVIYGALGENYYLVENFETAAQNFDKAIELLHETIPFTDYYFEHNSYSPDDSLNVFFYEFYAGQSYTNLFDADTAIERFENAQNYATSENDLAAIEGELEFINWDDGNILGSMRRDSLISLVNSDQLAEAEAGFFELKNSLKTTRAKDEIEWRLAVVQYQLGKEEEGANRLLNLVQRTEVDENGSPINEAYREYFNDFGTITYNLGVRYNSERDRNLALKYFLQSAKVSWSNRARSNLMIADLLSNNTNESLQYALLAEQEIESLSENDRKALYELLTNLYRSSGEMEMARNYLQLWREL